MVFSFLVSFLFSAPPFNMADKACTNAPAYDKAEITRSFERVPGTADYTVTVNIHSAGISGFAKYTEFLPPGAHVTILQNAGSTAATTDEKVKFVWTAFPADPEIKIVYTITFANLKLIMHYKGELRYLSDNVVQIHNLEPKDLKLIGE